MSFSQRGQAVLILLGAIALGLTIGLAIASKSTLDVQISRKLEESSRAFSAAEAGVEDVLKTPLPTGTLTRSLTFDGTRVSIQAQPTPAANTVIEYPKAIDLGDTLTVWFTNHETTSPYAIDELNGEYDKQTLDVCWSGQTQGAPAPGVEVTLVYKDSVGVYNSARRAFRVNPPSSCPSGDCFTSVDSAQPDQRCRTDSGLTYNYRKRLNFNPGPAGTFGVSLLKGSGNIKLYMRLKPYYDSVRLAINPQGGNAFLPPQALVDVVSQGQSVGGETTKIRVFKSFPAPPPVFDFALYSGGAITIGN